MYTVKYSLFRQEFYFGFGRMHIDVHRPGRQCQMQHTGGEFSHHNLVAVGFFQCRNQQLGFDRTVVDKESLQIPAGTGVCGLGNITRQMVAFPAAVYVYHPGAVPAVYAVHRRLQTAVTRGGQNLFPVPKELEGNFRMGQCLQLHGGSHPSAFHGVGFHELHPGGGVVEQIPDDDGGAFRAAYLRFFQNLPRFQVQAGAGDGPGSFGHQVNAADGGNGSQGFTSETHGTDGSQIFRRAQLGGCVSQKGGSGIFRGHAAAVVGDPQKGHAAVANLNGDFGATCIHGIFQQFFYYAGRPLHHFTGGNEVGNMGG